MHSTNMIIAQANVIFNFNQLVKKIKLLGGTELKALPIKGICWGLCAAYSYYASINKREIYIAVLYFINKLTQEEINLIAEAYILNSNTEVVCFAFSSDQIFDISLHEIISVFQQIVEWHSNQNILKTIGANFDKRRILGNIGKKLKEKLIFLPEGSRVFCEIKSKYPGIEHHECYLEKWKEGWYFFEPNEIRLWAAKPRSDIDVCEEFTEKIIQNYNPAMFELSMKFIFFEDEDKNIKIDEIINMLAKEAINIESTYKAYLRGTASRRDMACALIDSNIVSFNQETSISLPVKELQKKLEMYVQKDERFFELDFKDIMLSTHSDDYAVSTLYLAIKYYQINLVEKLLKNKIFNVNHVTTLGFTPLTTAIYHNNVEMVKVLLQHGAHVNFSFNEPKSWSIYSDHFKYKKYIKKTPLYMAIRYGFVEIAEILIKNGANFNQMSPKNKTLLHVAVYNNHQKIVGLLLKTKININQLNQSKETPLFIAANKGYKKIVSLLLKAKSSMDEPNEDEITPLHVAAYNGNVEIVELLLMNGAIISQKLSNNLECIFENLEIKQVFLKHQKIRCPSDSCMINNKFTLFNDNTFLLAKECQRLVEINGMENMRP